ncbi:MFS transporter [Streptomyces yaanensis]|uniref:MFS transporter n=1 Tax=Streptomyces yaanensis TaxID=1142239 RepID=A0ABV7SKN0_9ACTN
MAVTTPTSTIASPRLSRRQTNIVFVTILLGVLLAAIDQTIVSTALPTIVADLGGTGHMAWVVSAYMLAEAVSTVLVGKFGDLFGRKRVFQASAVVFVAGSVIAGAANSMVMLIAARAVQGIGGGGLMVTAMALIADVIPLRERGRYQGALGAVFGVTTVVGPTLGGLLTDHVSWRWCFYVNVPVAVVMVTMAARPSRPCGPRRDPSSTTSASPWSLSARAVWSSHWNGAAPSTPGVRRPSSG